MELIQLFSEDICCETSYHFPQIITSHYLSSSLKLKLLSILTVLVKHAGHDILVLTYE